LLSLSHLLLSHLLMSHLLIDATRRVW
jgi:hypothetical protein